VAAYHWYDDPALSRDGSALAMTDSGQQLVVADAHGPAWSGAAPYPEVDYVNPSPDLAAPTIRCRGAVGKTENPSWSRDGSVVAYGFPDGVHAMTRDCQDRLLAPGGSEPAFGPAGVTRRVNGHAGANAVRFKPRLRPGAYTLRLNARGTHAGARFTIRR
jgi:hypothetical protein